MITTEIKKKDKDVNLFRQILGQIIKMSIKIYREKIMFIKLYKEIFLHCD